MTYHSYRSLIITGRAIKRKGRKLILHYAGKDSEKGRVVVSYINQKEAKKAQALLARDLRERTGDGPYNAALDAYIRMIREAQEQRQVDQVEEQEPLEG